jgi:hypothetical protein
LLQGPFEILPIGSLRYFFLEGTICCLTVIIGGAFNILSRELIIWSLKESFRILALLLHLPTAQLQLSDTENSGRRWIGKISVTVMLRQPFMLLSRKRYKYHGSYLFTGNSVNGYSGLKRMDIKVTVLKIKS